MAVRSVKSVWCKTQQSHCRVFILCLLYFLSCAGKSLTLTPPPAPCYFQDMGHEGRHIPNRLRKCRRSRGYTQTLVGKILGMRSAVLICRWEKGNAIPNLEHLLLLYLLYQVPIEELYADYLEALRPQIKALMKEYLTDKWWIRRKNIKSGLYKRNARTIYLLINNERTTVCCSLHIMDLTEREKKLALEIAEILDDMDALKYHEDLVRQYSESYLREKLAKTLATQNIRKNRAALYVYLVTKSKRQRKNDSRN